MNIFAEQFEDEAIDSIIKFSKIAKMEGLPVELGFSGGKDSLVVNSLCDRSKINHIKIFNYAFEDPDTVKFIREKYPDVTIMKKEKSYFQLIREKGFLPTSDIRYCCEYFKENSKNAVITGIRRQESANRKKRKMFGVKGKKKINKYNEMFSADCTETGNTPLMLHPILYYSTDEIWEYIKKYNMAYPSLYDKGQTRCGCMLCPLAQLKANMYYIKKYPNLLPSFYRNAASRTNIDFIFNKDRDSEENLKDDPFRYLLYWLSASFRPSKRDKLMIDKFLMERNFNNT